MEFCGIDIDENLKRQISGCFESGRIPHAVIVEGADEGKRRKLTDFLAKALVCTADKAEIPCGKCPACIKTSAGFHSDISVYEGSGKSASVGIDDVREIRRNSYIVPNEAQRKVFIIRGAHRMNEYAQNALLKCLEEPPEYVVIILECEDKSLLLETVRSRAAVFRLGETGESEASGKKKEKMENLAAETADCLACRSEAELMSLLGCLEKDKESLKLCIRELILILRDAAVLSQDKNSRENKNIMISCNCEIAEKISHYLTASQLMGMIEALEEIDESADRNANNSLLLSRMCYMLWRNTGR